MSFERLRDTWDSLGATDPLWAVASVPSKKGNRWDVQEFFQTGERDVEDLFQQLDEHSLTVARRRCLDFGCGVGRLSQALCSYFERVDGVDIAQSMVELAGRYNRCGDRCQYHLNLRPDLSIFDDSTFDMVYSMIVLQHMEPDLAEGYVAEFMRVLSPGGLAAFQVPSRFLGFGRLPAGSHLARISVEGLHGGLELAAGTETTLSVRVRNVSPMPWVTTSSSPALIKLGDHWLRPNHSMVKADDGRTRIVEDLGPGEDMTVDLVVTAPQRPGRYVLELDLVEEGVTWFADTGSETCTLEAQVVGPRTPRRLADALRRLSRSSNTDDPKPATPPDFEMHALPRDRVEKAARAAGGEIAAVVECDVSGAGWENYRYFVRKT